MTGFFICVTISPVKNFDICILMDIYGELLTKRQRDALMMHYELDYSLSEIAENLSVSRQAANDAVKRGEAKLAEFEEKLGMCEKYERTRALAERLSSSDSGAARDAAQELTDIWGDSDGV